MEANELRIGSYYNYDGNSIKLDGSTLASYLQNDMDLYLEEIPLTEEWLLDFGFEIKTFNHLTLYYFLLNVLSNGQITFHPNKNGFNIDLGTNTGYQFGTTNIKSVHQLQNLYFALTGEELTIQL